ncbi:MAG: TRAP transporter small permease [Rhodobacteraceae bacterium]|nr:TRAP transporter small permease [Paracoccaceae bacterium]
MQTFMERLARVFALLGGITLVLLIMLVCASILGRSLNGILHSDTLQTAVPGLANALLGTGVGPISGDFEIVEAGMAFAIFAFLPICQLYGAHASVNIFTSHLPDRVHLILRLVIDIVFAGVLIILAWQLTQGGLSKFRSGQTTLLLEFPIWWSYAASIVVIWATVLTGIYVVMMRGAELATGRSALPVESGTDH